MKLLDPKRGKSKVSLVLFFKWMELKKKMVPLANMFSRLVRQDAGSKEILGMINDKNAVNMESPIHQFECATREYLKTDPLVLLEKAMEVHGLDPEDREHQYLAIEAWQAAKKNEFQPIKRKK